MAFKYIPGQAVDLTSNVFRNRCGGRDEACLAENDDILSLQIGVSEPTGTNKVDAFGSGNWTYGSGWSLLAGDADASSAGGTLSHTFQPSNGYYYKAIIVVNSYDETSDGLFIEGVEIGITGEGTYEVYFVGSGAAFQLSTSVGGSVTVNIDSIEVYELSALGWRVIDCQAETVLAEDYTNSNGYVTYYQNADKYPQIQLEFTWSDLSPTMGECYRLEVVDVEGAPSNPENLDAESVSCCYQLETTWANTLALSWTNDDDIQVGDNTRLIYEGLSYTQYLRIHGQLTNPTFPMDITRYDYSSGNKNQASAIVREEVEFIINGANERQYRSIAHALGHDKFYVDGLRHFMEDDELQPRWRRLRKAAPASVQLVRLYNFLKNTYCNPVVVDETNTWIVEVLFDAGDDTATITWNRNGSFTQEDTDGASSFTYDGDSFASWSKTAVNGQSIDIVRDDTSADETLTLTGTYS